MVKWLFYQLFYLVSFICCSLFIFPNILFYCFVMCLWCKVVITVVQHFVGSCDMALKNAILNFPVSCPTRILKLTNRNTLNASSSFQGFYCLRGKNVLYYIKMLELQICSFLIDVLVSVPMCYHLLKLRWELIPFDWQTFSV